MEGLVYQSVYEEYKIFEQEGLWYLAYFGYREGVGETGWLMAMRSRANSHIPEVGSLVRWTYTEQEQMCRVRATYRIERSISQVLEWMDRFAIRCHGVP